MRKLTVRLDERDQALPGRADYLQAAPYLLVDILVEGKQGVAQGGDRGDGVHDLLAHRVVWNGRGLGSRLRTVARIGHAGYILQRKEFSTLYQSV